MALREIFPGNRDVEAEDAYCGLELASLAPAGRPYTVLNMITSIDGRAAVGGRSAPLSCEADRRIFHLLRTQADAVMVGAGTLRSERYGRLVRDPDLRDKRSDEGLAPDPLAVVVSGSLDLPASIPLFESRESKVLILTNSDRELPKAEAELEVERFTQDELPLAEAMSRLRAEHGIRSVLVEGGPSLCTGLLEANLIDELFLTISPKVVSGRSPLTLLEGELLPSPRGFDLVSVHLKDSFVFLRFKVQRRS